jgi:hypothetical protein
VGGGVVGAKLPSCPVHQCSGAANFFQSQIFGMIDTGFVMPEKIEAGSPYRSTCSVEMSSILIVRCLSHALKSRTSSTLLRTEVGVYL